MSLSKIAFLDPIPNRRVRLKMDKSVAELSKAENSQRKSGAGFFMQPAQKKYRTEICGGEIAKRLQNLRRSVDLKVSVRSDKEVNANAHKIL